MDSTFACPVCGEDRWQEIAAYTYRPDEADSRLSDYLRLRQRVLFEVWCPGAERVVLRARLCRGCGFAAYAPRPSEADLEAKYRFLQGTERDIGGSDSSSRGLERDRRRAERTCALLRRHLGNDLRRVLDVGGGDGKLLAPFIEGAVDCALVDYNRSPLPGVRRLGDTLADVPEGYTFDAVICSHVLEHVAKPGGMLRDIRRILTPTGVVVAEVPLEVWRGIPIGSDPVTHVNFFTSGAFQELFERGDFEVIEASTSWSSYGRANLEVAVVVARPTPNGSAHASRGGYEDAQRRLRPSIPMEMRRQIRARGWLGTVRVIAQRVASGRVRRRLPLGQRSRHR